jgi:Caspase domain
MMNQISMAYPARFSGMMIAWLLLVGMLAPMAQTGCEGTAESLQQLRTQLAQKPTTEDLEDTLQRLKSITTEGCPNHGDAWYLRAKVEERLKRPANYSLSKAREYRSAALKSGLDPFGSSPSLPVNDRPFGSPASTSDTTPPTIRITSPSLDRSISVRITDQNITKLLVAGEASDASGIREVLVQNQPARLLSDGKFEIELSLLADVNQITVKATDNTGLPAILTFPVQRGAAPPAPVSTTTTERYFALVIGNNSYPNFPAGQQLKTAIHDAQELAQLLQKDFSFEVKLLLNAKRGEIIKAIDEYRRTLHPEDHLLLYYAGHGEFDKATAKAYWLPSDAETGDTANWIIADDVTSKLRAIASRHILIVSDSCYSGMLTRATFTKVNVPAERERYLDKMASGTARLLMGSGGNEPVADGGGSGHSVFARALLDGLRGIELRRFTAEELFHAYIKERVAGQADQTPVYNPLQNSGHEAGDFVFVRNKR